MVESVLIVEYTEKDKEFVIGGISDLQEVERQITDTRRPGAEVGAAYLDQVQNIVKANSGAILVARGTEKQLGFIICWIERENNVAETPDSTIYGYISDAYVTPEARGQGIFKLLNAKAEEYLKGFPEVKRIRINVLAENARAIAAYKSTGYGEYEIMLEKKVK